jgi:rRNA pseudouridine-1189 N-methylase Emg1 (Nep1/Mra1 family)
MVRCYQTSSYEEECISVSQYPLSGAYAAARLVNAYEKAWGIV